MQYNCILKKSDGNKMKKQYILTPYFLDQPLYELKELAQSDWIVNERPLPDADKQSRMSLLHKEIAKQVSAAITDGLLPVSIAGDCCTAIGVMAGLQRTGSDPLFIWFDAHGDFNTWETTPSGFLGGMPLAMIAGLGEQTMVEAVGLEPVKQEHVILTDGRDLDPGEQELVSGSNILHLKNPMDLLEYDFRERPIYVHFDTDIVNPLDAPAMNYIAPGGPRAEELGKVFRHLAKTGLIKAISVSTWNPELDVGGRSKDTILNLLQEFVS
jgi:arginase